MHDVLLKYLPEHSVKPNVQERPKMAAAAASQRITKTMRQTSSRRLQLVSQHQSSGRSLVSEEDSALDGRGGSHHSNKTPIKPQPSRRKLLSEDGSLWITIDDNDKKFCQ